MNAMEHYREAEKLVRAAAGLNGGQLVDRSAAQVTEYLAAAQVHATLAAAAVQAMSGQWREDTSQEWRQTFDRVRAGLSGAGDE